MRITKLKLNYFGRFQNREIELKPGINLIYGDNEAGKSTIHTFIKGMLFGIERLRGRGSASKEDTYTRYLPWEYPGAYSGSMDLRIEDKDYRLQRSFHANDKNFTILDLSTGREVKLKEGLISELVPGLSESTFKNTISIEQLKAQTDAELVAQVRNYIANLSIAKSKEVNVAKAVSGLNDQRKQLEPSQNVAILKTLQAEIVEGLEKETKIDQLSVQLKELLVQEKQLQEQKELIAAATLNEDSARMEQLPAVLEKYRSYQDLSKQVAALDQQEKELQVKTSSIEKDQIPADSLKEDVKEAEKLRIKLAELEAQEPELLREQEVKQSFVKGNPIKLVVPLWIIASVMLIVIGVKPVVIVADAIVFVLILLFITKVSNRKKQELSDITSKVNDVQQQKASVQESIDSILKRNQVTAIEFLSQKQEEILKNFYTLENITQQQKDLVIRKNELENRKDVMYETIMKYLQYFVKEEELTGLSMQRLQEEITHRRQKAQGKLSEINQQYDNCKLRIEKLRWEIKTMEGNEEQLLKNQERYAELERKQREDALELEAIKLALSTINELGSDIHDSFGQQLNQAVSEVIKEVTGQKYNDLKVDEKLEVKVGWNGDYVLLDRLSAGTIDQVYFALRLAVADLLLGKDEVPLLLDDSFVLYDESRVKASLTRISQRKQIVLFTCHKREELLLRELGLPYHMVDLTCK